MEGAGELLGREPALAMARAALDQAVAGAGRLLLVTGDAGIGKTAFAQAVTSLAAARGCTTLWAACWQGEGTPSYWPWMQIIRQATASAPASPPAPWRVSHRTALRGRVRTRRSSRRQITSSCSR